MLGDVSLNNDELKTELLSRVDEIVEYIKNGKTIEMRIGKDGSINIFEVKKKIVKPNSSK